MTTPAPLRFACWGVGIAVEATDAAHLDWLASQLDMVLPGHVEPIGGHRVQHVFSVESQPSGGLALFLDGAPIGDNPSASVALQYLCTRLKITVAAATATCVVVHAGVVAINRRAVVMPAHSFHGKTTLVRALLARGATYYSDDLAVIDTDGLVHPFAKTLSVRGVVDAYVQVEYSAESLGGVAGSDALPVGLVLFTKFVPDATWAPQPLTPAEATLGMLEHTLNASSQPRLVLGVLRHVVTRDALLWRSDRGEADAVVEAVWRALAPLAGG